MDWTRTNNFQADENIFKRKTSGIKAEIKLVNTFKYI